MVAEVRARRTRPGCVLATIPGLLVAILLFVLALLASPQRVVAHESRPAYLQIREVAPDRYEVLWRTPVLSGMPLPVMLVLPDNVRDLVAPVTQRLNDSLLERRKVETGSGGLAGQRIAFPGLEATITDVLVDSEWLEGGKTRTIVRPSQPWIEIPAQQSFLGLARSYTRLGIEHILSGVDHLLFVLALILVTRGAWRLVKAVTAFTLAHSITLGLATLGVVHVPSRPVEAVIALSIVFVAAEVVRARRGDIGLAGSAPWIVALLFGLLHGLGFAAALSEIGLPHGHIPAALLFFNLGVEMGQLAFIAVVLGAVVIFRRMWFALPHWANLVLPYMIGSFAMLWVFQRVFVL